MDNLGDDFRAKLFQIPHHTAKYETASFGRRFGAFLIDLLVINFIIFRPFSDIFAGFVNSAALLDTLPDHIYTSIIVISILVLLYFSLLQHYAQQTIGMMILKLYVIPRPGFWRSVTRNLYVLPFFPFNILWIVEPFYLYHKGRRFLETLTRTDTVIYHG